MNVGCGVTDQDIDLAECFAGAFHEPDQIVLRRNIGRDGDCGAGAVRRIDRSCDVVDGALRAGRNHDFRALVGQPFGNGAAYAPRGAGDDGYATGQVKQGRFVHGGQCFR